MDTGATPDWPSEPTRRDRLLYGIGRVCEVHVLLDWNLGILQAELAILVNPSDPEEAFHPTLATGWRIGHCKERLRQSALPEDLRTAGRGVLEAAHEANDRRNRVVHDAWLERIEARTDPRSTVSASVRRGWATTNRQTSPTCTMPSNASPAWVTG